MIAPDLAWENDRVINMVQALTGAITPNMRGVAIETDFAARRMVVHFALVAEHELDREEIEEILFSLDAVAYWEFDELETRVWVGDDWVHDWPGRHHRCVFSAWRPPRSQPSD